MKNWFEIGKAMARRHYGFAKWRYLRGLKRWDRRFPHPPLLVHQMGKVGSTSVTDSLRAIDIGRPIYHTHFLTEHLINKYERRRAAYLGTDREGLLRHIWQYEHLRNRIERGLGGEENWKVISLVRDPVARNLSNFFTLLQVTSLKRGPRVVKSVEYGFEIPWAQDVGAELIRLFFDLHDPLLADKFFEREIQGVFGVDVFGSHFDARRGYQIYNGRGVEVLLIQMERLNQCFDAAIYEFLGLGGVKVVRRNVGSEKSYAELYDVVKAHIRFPRMYLDDVYGSRTARQFYSDTDLAKFRSKWREEC